MAILELLPAALLSSYKVKSAVETEEGLSLNVIGGRNVFIAQGAGGEFTVTTSRYTPGGDTTTKTISASRAKLILSNLRAELQAQTGLESP